MAERYDMTHSILGSCKEYRKTATVRAQQMPYPFKVLTLEGMMFGEAGDYLCIGIKGERWLIKKEIFEATYELVGAE